MEFSTRSMHQIIESQTGKRVSEPAANQLGEKLEQITTQIAKEAIKNAQEDGYKTVKQKHIQKALKPFIDYSSKGNAYSKNL